MNELQIFNNPKFGQVRTVDIGSKTYFVASDIARSLGYKDPVSAISRHTKGTVKHLIPTNGGEQMMNVIPEGDIYRLATNSELPGADEFERWIFDEVLPSIRKTGSYSMIPKSFAEALRLAADLEEEKQKLLPKAEQYDRFISGENLQDMGAAAKAIGWGRNNLFKELRRRKIIMKDNEAYQEYIDRGYFVVKETPITAGDKNFNRIQTYVTPKGIDWLAKLLNKEDVAHVQTHQKAF